MLKQNSDSLNISSLKQSLYNLGYFHKQNQQPFEAIDSFVNLIDLGDEDEMTQYARLELGILYKSIGEFHKAIENYKKIVDFYQEAGDHLALLASSYFELADTYGMMGFVENSERIKSYLNKTDSLYKRTGSSNIFEHAQLNQLEGNRLLKTGYYSKAIDYHKMVLVEHPCPVP